MFLLSFVLFGFMQVYADVCIELFNLETDILSAFAAPTPDVALTQVSPVGKMMLSRSKQH